MSGRTVFDEHYYHRYYGNPRTRVAGPQTFARLGRFVCSYLKHVEQPVHHVLDLGCGVGLWRSVIRRQFPDASYTGVEISDWACREYGWERGSVVDFRADGPCDLVICQGVLQYLPAAEARRAIANLARNCGGALYLEVLTSEDWEQNCDRERSDGGVQRRSAAWYRRELGRYFSNCGGGVFLSPDSPAVLYELEKLG